MVLVRQSLVTNQTGLSRQGTFKKVTSFSDNYLIMNIKEREN
jgi:hypothetical protein